MAVPKNICIELPRLSPELPKVSLPLGAEFSGVIDFANGLPRDCTVAMNLMGNVNLALGNLKCLMAMMEVFQKLKEAVSDPVPTNIPGNLVGLLEPLSKLSGCFLSITPAAICVTVKDVIQAIIKILECLIEEIQSVVSFRARLDVGAALGNSKLADILFCAQGNADTSTASVLKTLETLAMLLNVLAGLPGAEQLGIPQLPTSFSLSAETPSLSDIADVSAIQDVLNVLNDVVGVLREIVGAVPC